MLADDRVEHLAWRLRHGELPTDKAHHPKIVILHAGTNGEMMIDPYVQRYFVVWSAHCPGFFDS